MPRDLTQAANEYASQNQLAPREILGSGIHGQVLLVQRLAAVGATALKIYYDQEFYRRELMVYDRLKAAAVREILGFAVPQLVRADDKLLALEMTVVERPFVLDFAGAYLDNDAPVFDDDVWTTWEADKIEKFGFRWPEVQAVLTALEEFGIQMLDVNPGNIAFAN